MSADVAARVRLRVEEGDTWRIRGKLLQCKLNPGDPDVPFDITGWVLLSHWRPDPNSPTVTVAPTYSVTDGAAGEFEGYVSSLDTAQLGSFEGVHTVLAILPDGTDKRIWEGPVLSDDMDVTR